MTAARTADEMTAELGSFVVTDSASTVLRSAPIGASVVVLLHDPVGQRAAMLHYLLPNSRPRPARAARQLALFGDEGLAMLLAHIETRLRNPLAASVHVIGGADMETSHDTAYCPMTLGSRNLAIARTTLDAAGIEYDDAHTGGRCHRVVTFDVATGELSVDALPVEEAP